MEADGDGKNGTKKRVQKAAPIKTKRPRKTPVGVQKENPMLNNVILAKLYQYVPLNDLLNCRLVSRKWNLLTNAAVKERTLIKFEHCNGDDQKTCQDKIVEFVGVFKRSKKHGIPCNFSFINVDMNTSTLQYLFAFFGPFIKYVHLKLEASKININTFQEMLLNRIPILETLEIDQLPDEVIKGIELDPKTQICLSNLIINDSKTYGHKFFYEIFKISQCLEQVKVLQQESTSVLMALRDSELLSTMKNIKFKKPSDGELDTLVKLSMDSVEFNSIIFAALSDYFSSRTLETFLKLQKDSLEYVSIGGSTYHLKIDCPSMKNVHTLKLNSYNRVLAPITCPTQFPNLKHLELGCSALESNWESYFPRSGSKITFHGLKTLSLCGMVNNPASIKCLGKMFPNIKILHMKVYKPSNEVILHIWRYWVLLEDMVLHMYGCNKNIDTLFTGISVSECNQIHSVRSLDPYANLPEIQRRTSILDLKKLKNLCLYVMKPEHPTCALTDIAGYYAFGMMPNLRKLLITWSHMSKECVKFLTEKLPRCQISNHRLRHYRLGDEMGKAYFEISR